VAQLARTPLEDDASGERNWCFGPAGRPSPCRYGLPLFVSDMRLGALSRNKANSFPGTSAEKSRNRHLLREGVMLPEETGGSPRVISMEYASADSGYRPVVLEHVTGLPLSSEAKRRRTGTEVILPRSKMTEPYRRIAWRLRAKRAFLHPTFKGSDARWIDFRRFLRSGEGDQSEGSHGFKMSCSADRSPIWILR